jgi:hypothetical protein
MTVLSADSRTRQVMDWGHGGNYPVLAAAVIYKGALVCVDANGYAIPATDTAAIYCVGVAEEAVTGGTSSGDKWVKVGAGRAYLFAATSITQAMVGEPMYVVDDNTVDDTSTNLCLVGVLVKYVTTTSGWVLVAPSYSLALSGVTSSAGELNYLDITGAGTVQASKAVVVDANKDASAFRTVGVVNLDAGSSGVAGTVDVFPTTASKGKLSLTCSDQAGNTTVTVVADEMAAARTIHLPDPGATSYILQSTGTDTATSATATEITGNCDASVRLVAAGGTETCAPATHEGRITCLDTASGSVVTLPAATGSGAIYKFVITVVPTSNAHIVKVTGTDTMFGAVLTYDADSTAVTFYAAAGTDDTLTLPGTTAGGSIGDWFEFTDVVAAKWAVKGMTTCAAGSNISDVFSATV